MLLVMMFVVFDDGVIGMFGEDEECDEMKDVVVEEARALIEATMLRLRSR